MAYLLYIQNGEQCRMLELIFIISFRFDPSRCGVDIGENCRLSHYLLRNKFCVPKSYDMCLLSMTAKDIRENILKNFCRGEGGNNKKLVDQSLNNKHIQYIPPRSNTSILNVNAFYLHFLIVICLLC